MLFAVRDLCRLFMEIVDSTRIKAVCNMAEAMMRNCRTVDETLCSIEEF